MVDRDTKMKSKLDPTSRDREKNRGVRNFVCFRIWDRPVSLVWCEGAQWFNSVGERIDCGYIGYWMIWVQNIDILSSLGHDLIVHRVCAGFAQGLSRVWVSPFYSMINCCRAQGRSREVLPEALQSNQKTSHINSTTKVSLFCIFFT